MKKFRISYLGRYKTIVLRTLNISTFTGSGSASSPSILGSPSTLVVSIPASALKTNLLADPDGTTKAEALHAKRDDIKAVESFIFTIDLEVS